MMITNIIIINHHNHNHDHNQARTAAAAWSTTGSPPTTRSPSTPTSPRSTSTTSRTRTFRMPTPSPFRAMWVYPCHTTMNHEPMSCEKKTIFQNLFPFIPQSCQNVRDRIKCACFNWGHLLARMAHWPAQAWPNISACIPQLPSVGGRGPSSQRWPSRVSLFLEVAKRQRSAQVLCIRLHFQFLAPKLFFKQAHCVLKADDQHDPFQRRAATDTVGEPRLVLQLMHCCLLWSTAWNELNVRLIWQMNQSSLHPKVSASLTATTLPDSDLNRGWCRGNELRGGGKDKWIESRWCHFGRRWAMPQWAVQDWHHHPPIVSTHREATRNRNFENIDPWAFWLDWSFQTSFLLPSLKSCLYLVIATATTPPPKMPIRRMRPKFASQNFALEGRQCWPDIWEAGWAVFWIDRLAPSGTRPHHGHQLIIDSLLPHQLPLSKPDCMQVNMLQMCCLSLSKL